MKTISPWIAIACSLTFLVAINYCSLEVFAAAHSGHHDENSQTQGPEEDAPCCATLQAILTSKVETPPTSHATWFLHPLALYSAGPDFFFESSRVTSGLSPPAREPTSHTPFYHTVFANHAPPVCLA